MFLWNEMLNWWLPGCNVRTFTTGKNYDVRTTCISTGKKHNVRTITTGTNYEVRTITTGKNYDVRTTYITTSKKHKFELIPLV